MKVILCVLGFLASTQAFTSPCNPLINGVRTPGNCNVATPAISNPAQFLDSNGQPIDIPKKKSHSKKHSPSSPLSDFCIPGDSMTTQLIEIINNILVNVHIVDDGVPVYLHNGQLMVNPKYLKDIKKKSSATNMDNYFCPHDSSNRPCFVPTYRSGGSEPTLCTKDSECKNDEGFLHLCCYDYCLQSKTCKPAIAKSM